jgi:tRNA pseudouridine55 synthase
MTQPTYHGLLVLDKPGGLTSRAAVDRVQRWFGRSTRIGHTGTLDPLATGVLVLCLGNATRLTEYVQDMAKTYRSCLLLGATSDTDDADGTITPRPGATLPDRNAVLMALQEFVGQIEQVPPAYSAARVSGRRAYDLARRGEDVSLAPRRVRIHGIDVLAYDYPRLEIEVRCGKGTYIRSLARDLGERLGCGALVQTLRRTRVGPFTAAEAVTLEATAETARARVLPLASALSELPRLSLDAALINSLRHGQPVSVARLPQTLPADRLAIFDTAGNLVGVALVDRPRGLLRPEKILLPSR